MGCAANKPAQFNIEEEYKNKNLPIPEGNELENDFEKKAFMTINLIRHDPKFFLPMLRGIKGKYCMYSFSVVLTSYPLANKLYNGKKSLEL
jgi:hypothetical protein